MFCEESDPICIIGALTIFLVDTVVYYLHDTRQVGPAIVIYRSILLQGDLIISLEDLILFYLAKPVGVSITIFVLVENGV